MVDMGEIIQGLLGAFGPFVGKATITLIIVLGIGLGIDIVAHILKNRKK